MSKEEVKKKARSILTSDFKIRVLEAVGDGVIRPADVAREFHRTVYTHKSVRELTRRTGGILAEFAKEGLVKCLNPHARKGKLYRITELGATVRKYLKEEGVIGIKPVKRRPEYIEKREKLGLVEREGNLEYISHEIYLREPTLTLSGMNDRTKLWQELIASIEAKEGELVKELEEKCELGLGYVLYIPKDEAKKLGVPNKIPVYPLRERALRIRDLSKVIYGLRDEVFKALVESEKYLIDTVRRTKKGKTE
jgi:hypothetical protein